ncbi:MAG TPA: HAD family hydrolase [Candidatus Saccharimonadales bacterium]
MKFKALIFDLDGTAMPSVSDALPSDRVVQAVNQVKGRIKLCAATGRGIRNAKPILDRLGLTDPCVISAGTRIIDPITNEILWEVAISPDDVQKILAVCKPYPHEVIVCDELMGEGAPAAQRTITQSVNVIYIMEAIQEDGNLILGQLDKIPNITAVGVLGWSGVGMDIHITNRQATKEHAIAELLKMINVKKEETVGVGDANNDVHLFRGVGRKVAMGNATELLKSQADEVCDTVYNDGLAKLIEEITK